MDIKSVIPSSVISKAFEFNSEFAWRPEDIAELASVLRKKNVAVLGGEVWERTDDAPTIGDDIYHWTSKIISSNETWDAYVERTLDEMIRFTEGLPKEKLLDKKTYINVVFADKP